MKTHHGLLHARKDLANTQQCHCPSGPHLLVQFLSGQTLFYSHPMFFNDILFLVGIIINFFSCQQKSQRSCHGDRAALVWLSDPVFCSQALQQDKCRLMNQGCPVEGHPWTGTANFSAAVSLDTGTWTQTPFEAWSQCTSPLARIVYGDRSVKVSAATVNSHLTLNLNKQNNNNTKTTLEYILHH